MKRALLALLLFAPLTSCANPSLREDAEGLRDRLADLPGVETVDLTYVEPVPLDSGKLRLEARMDTDTTDAELSALVGAAYAAFVDTHHDEEGDLDIAVDDDVIHLRSFQPLADVEAVERAVADAAEVRPLGAVRADLNTQDVRAARHVHTRFRIELARGGPAAVLRTLTALERRHGELTAAGWSVQVGGELGWSLGASDGFPDQRQRSSWAALREDLPAGFTVSLENGITTVQAPPDTEAGVVATVAERHVQVLGGHRAAYYDLFVGRHLLASVIQGECFFNRVPGRPAGRAGAGRGLHEGSAPAALTHGTGDGRGLPTATRSRKESRLRAGRALVLCGRSRSPAGADRPHK